MLIYLHVSQCYYSVTCVSTGASQSLSGEMACFLGDHVYFSESVAFQFSLHLILQRGRVMMMKKKKCRQWETYFVPITILIVSKI